jgi:hypothetical protein
MNKNNIIKRKKHKQQQHGSRRQPTGTTDTVCEAVQSAKATKVAENRI